MPQNVWFGGIRWCICRFPRRRAPQAYDHRCRISCQTSATFVSGWADIGTWFTECMGHHDVFETFGRQRSSHTLHVSHKTSPLCVFPTNYASQYTSGQIDLSHDMSAFTVSDRFNTFPFHYSHQQNCSRFSTASYSFAKEDRPYTSATWAITLLLW